jgi:hypothetical protein
MDQHMSMSGICTTGQGKDRQRTDWTGLEHQFPNERIGTPFIEVALR